jgi:hypothetical protein
MRRGDVGGVTQLGGAMVACIAIVLGVPTWNVADDDGSGVVRRWFELEEVYYQGSLSEARKSVEEAIRLVKEDFAGEYSVKSRFLAHAYASMYLIDYGSGLEDAAYLDYIRGRYWRAEELRARGVPVGEIGRRLRALTEARFYGEALSRDLRATDGKGAAFTRALGLGDGGHED